MGPRHTVKTENQDKAFLSRCALQSGRYRKKGSQVGGKGRMEKIP